MTRSALLQPVALQRGIVACVVPNQRVVLFDLSDGRADASLDLRSGLRVNIDQTREDILREALTSALEDHTAWSDDLAPETLDILREACRALGGVPPTTQPDITRLVLAADITLEMNGTTYTVTIDDNGEALMTNDVPEAVRREVFSILIARFQERT